MEGRIVSIYTYPEPKASPVEHQSIEIVIGKGLTGDHARHPKRHVTLLSAESWTDALRDLGTPLPPSTRRANVVVSGIPLDQAVSRRLRLGSVLLDIHGETTPCGNMDAACLGLRAALTPALRGGVYGTVTTGGRISVGDPVSLA